MGKWTTEKGLIERVQSLKEQAEELRFKFESAQRGGDYEAASEIQYGALPANAEATAKAELELAAVQEGEGILRDRVTENDIADVISRWTGIPVTKLVESEQKKLLEMEDNLHQRVIGQHKAVVAVSDAVRRARAGLQDPDRPIGSFMFLGPTGVGKTELAKALAEFLFDDEESMIRIDMSEFMEKHSVARLIGAPPGYVGYDEGGQLTEAVRRKPYSVILLDEIEKAHSDVFNTLLQVLDDGRLTDSKGRTVDMRNVVLIMTSNVGARHLMDTTQPWKEREQHVFEALAEAFRPEFLNRVDDRIVFEPLGRDVMGPILEIQLRRVETLLAAKELKLSVTDRAKEAIADAGFDPLYGARPLKRAIQQYLLNPMAKEIVSGGYQPGDRIEVDSEGDEISFSRCAGERESDVA